MERPRIIVGISGASGVIYGVRLLEILREHATVETHLCISQWGEENLRIETDYTLDQVCKLADVVYQPCDMAAAISSGSFYTSGMIVLPCSMKTCSAIANGFDYNLLTRAAGVMIKENRSLVLCPRETPLSTIHLENMLKLSRLGVRIVPPMPGFYHRPETITDLIDHYVMRVLDQLNIRFDNGRRWGASDIKN